MVLKLCAYIFREAKWCSSRWIVMFFQTSFKRLLSGSALFFFRLGSINLHCNSNSGGEQIWRGYVMRRSKGLDFSAAGRVCPLTLVRCRSNHADSHLGTDGFFRPPRLCRYRRTPRLWLEPTTKGIATRLIRRECVAYDCLE